jgi:hypothetical protein
MWKEHNVGNIKALSQHLPGSFEEKNKKPQSGWLASGSRIEPGTSKIWTENHYTMTFSISP